MARYGDDMNRDRWRDDDRERSSWRSGGNEREDERGFFERAGEEIRSWFSDDDDRGPGRDYERDRSSGWSGSGSSWDRDRNEGRGGMSRRPGGGWSSSPNRDFGGGSYGRDRDVGQGRMSRDFDDRSSFGGMAQGGRSSGSFDHENERGYGASRSGSDWRSTSQQDRSRMGGYGGQGASRSDRDQGRSGHAQSWGEANRGQSSSWDRNRERDQNDESFGYGSAMGGTLGGFGNQTFGSSQDDHYRSWRDRQMSELDRDYDDYCREREQQFHSDFDSWRRSRPARSPSAATNASGSDLGAAANAGVGTTTSSITGTAGAGSAGSSGAGSAIGGGSPSTGDATSQTGTADTGAGGSGRSGSRSRG
jgi:hypothetical protein